MTQETAVIIFKSAWGLLLFIAVLGQLLFMDKPKRKAGVLTNLLVITPFVVVFGLFFLGRYVGTYENTSTTRITGVVFLGFGMIGYIISHFYLRRNWSVSASIKEGHKLIKRGPYRLVRHPMYSSMTLTVFGSGFLIANYLIILFTIVVFMIYYIRARNEEALLRKEFPEYNEYVRSTKMLLPCIL
jgi:protein-S-isoprenylcysteine O-methyltransferase Ste14